MTDTANANANATTAARILYLVPTRSAPTGGVNTSFEHVAILARAGYDAAVLQMDSANPYAFAPTDAPTLFLDQGLRLTRSDVLVLPEGSPEFYAEMAAIQGVRRLVFCQNHFSFIHMLGPHRHWNDLGINGVFACSNEAARFVRETVGLPEVPVVPCNVDPDIFQPLPKKLQIAHMPRKMPQETSSIKNILSWRRPDLADVPWIPIDNLPRTQAAKILGESAVFLATSWYEGLGLPPLEAMACGCLVTGFHGWGGLDYVSPQNALWCEEGNIETAAAALAEAVDMARTNHPATTPILEAAATTAARYSPQATRQTLLTLWPRILDATFAP